MIVARGDRWASPPSSRPPETSTTRGSSSSRSRRPTCRPAARREATAIALNLAAAMDLVGTLTVELFLLRDGSLVVNELAPRVHNSGHWTIEGAATSQFEQHVRAICGLPLGVDQRARADGHGQRARDRFATARRDSPGVDEALAVPGTHLHLYDKRRVFERRKMGHVTGTRSDPAGGARPRPRGALEAALGGRARDDAPRVGVVGGSRSDFPVLEDAVTVLDELGVPSELRVVSAHRTPDHLFRYARDGRGAGHPGDHRRRRRGRPPAGHARREDDAAGHRRADPDPAARRARLAAVDRPDAARHPGRDRCHRQRHERGAARGRDPRPVRRGARTAP